MALLPRFSCKWPRQIERMSEDMHILLARYFSGAATAEEATRVRSWASVPENRAEFDLLQKMWTATVPAATAPFNTNKAWSKVDARIQGHSGGRVRSLYRYLVAAAAVLALAFGFWWFSRSSDNWMTANATTAMQTLRLEDGTTVYLRPGSTLRYPKAFGSKERAVELEGEAFFDVHHDPAHPFLIDAGAADVKVLGTSFSVKTGDEVLLVVKTGLVQFSAAGREGVKVAAGERAVYQSGTFSKETNTDPNFNAWQTRVLHFQDTSLDAVARTLSDYYGVTIGLAKADAVELANTRVTLELRDQPLDQALKQLSLITSYLVQEKTKGIYEISLAR